ncbi:MAG TPA: hypothetical protein VFC19_25250, partial [Candidatus Limnocylindrales bacterium]|nr:hypothetical protein [Candidatus Limnocylindrales bacterium]
MRRFGCQALEVVGGGDISRLADATTRAMEYRVDIPVPRVVAVVLIQGIGVGAHGLPDTDFAFHFGPGLQQSFGCGVYRGAEVLRRSLVSDGALH